jgi:hypothetical protein
MFNMSSQINNMNQNNQNNQMIGGTPISEILQLPPQLQSIDPRQIDNPIPNTQIRSLINDVNHSLDSYSPKQHYVKRRIIDNSEDNDTDTNTNTNTDTDTDNEVKHKSGLYGELVNMLKEPFLLIFIYVLLSQGFIKKLFSGYFNQLHSNPETGGVPITGVLIYGVILTTIFMISRKLILKK